jgi:hypothetical protein
VVDRRVAFVRGLPAPPLVLDQRADRGGRRTDVEHLGPLRQVRHDGFDAVIGQQLDQRRLGLRQALRRQEIRAEAREVANRGAAVEIDRRDVRAV